MSLTSYRAAPPRVGDGEGVGDGECGGCVMICGWIGGPGGDLLSRALRHSTMGAGEFHGRVRDGIGCRLPAMTTRSSNAPLGGLCPQGVIAVLAVCRCITGGAALFAFAKRLIRRGGS